MSISTTARSRPGSCVALSCLWPLAQAYLPVAASTAEWDPVEARMLQPRLGSLVYVWRWSWFYGWMTTATPLGLLPARHEQALGMGLLTTGVVLYAIATQRRRRVVHLMALLVLVLWVPAMMGRVSEHCGGSFTACFLGSTHCGPSAAWDCCCS